MISSTRWPAVAAALIALLALCSAKPATKIEEEELKLLEKYEKVLADERADEEGDGIDEREQSAERLSGERELLDLLEGFSQLNGQLEARLPESDDVNENLALAKSFVQAPAKADQKQAKAAESLVLLGQVHGRPKGHAHMCSAFSETVLSLNSYLAGALARTSRLARIVRRVCEEHARECQGVYATKYHEKLAQMDGEERAHLSGVLSDELVANFLVLDPSPLIDLMHGYEPRERGIDLSWRKKLARRVFEELKTLATGKQQLEFIVREAGGQFSVDGPRFELAYAQLLKQPCSSFVALFGPDVFAPATFDFGTSNAALLSARLSPEEIAFAFGFFRFKVCEMLLNDKRNGFAQDVKKVINN